MEAIFLKIKRFAQRWTDYHKLTQGIGNAQNDSAISITSAIITCLMKFSILLLLYKLTNSTLLGSLFQDWLV